MLFRPKRSSWAANRSARTRVEPRTRAARQCLTTLHRASRRSAGRGRLAARRASSSSRNERWRAISVYGSRPRAYRRWRRKYQPRARQVSAVRRRRIGSSARGSPPDAGANPTSAVLGLAPSRSAGCRPPGGPGHPWPRPALERVWPSRVRTRKRRRLLRKLADMNRPTGAGTSPVPRCASLVWLISSRFGRPSMLGPRRLSCQGFATRPRRCDSP